MNWKQHLLQPLEITVLIRRQYLFLTFSKNKRSITCRYRHYTTQRSLILAALATYLTVNGMQYLQQIVPKHNVKLFYCIQFLIYAAKVPLLLRVVPWIAMWPYKQESSVQWGSYKVKTS